MNKIKVHKKSYSEHICLNCQKPFQSYANTKRKYCSHRCYIATRFGVSQMNNEIFQTELTYQVTMLYVQDMLRNQLITVDDYCDFQQKMQEMYYPLLSKYMDETLDK